MEELQIYVIHLKARAMKETKSMCSLWEHDVQWERMSVKQKLITVWFSMSFVMLGIAGVSMWFTAAVVANFGVAAYCCVKYVPMSNE